MAYNFAAESFHTKKLYSSFLSQVKYFDNGVRDATALGRYMFYGTYFLLLSYVLYVFFSRGNSSGTAVGYSYYLIKTQGKIENLSIGMMASWSGARSFGAPTS